MISDILILNRLGVDDECEGQTDRQSRRRL